MQCEEKTSERESPTLVSTTRGVPASNTRKEASVSFYTLLTWHAVHSNFYGPYQHRSTEAEDKGRRRSPRSQLQQRHLRSLQELSTVSRRPGSLLCFHTFLQHQQEANSGSKMTAAA